ncbi:unnamed protein product [Dovyalis caffra]|uniref:Uncharacterized protein n=1 Tax=Dovyalis caffra TaxID=77055 RepID=A0AAV1STZ9_9ROSI|nr:unnamed protein product [Dovyalis caffra]
MVLQSRRHEHHGRHHHDHVHDSAVSSASIVSEGRLDFDEQLAQLESIVSTFLRDKWTSRAGIPPFRTTLTKLDEKRKPIETGMGGRQNRKQRRGETIILREATKQMNHSFSVPRGPKEAIKKDNLSKQKSPVD